MHTDTVDGVVHVRNEGTPPVWTLELAAELGVPGGGGEPGPEEFGRVHGLAVDEEGGLWVGDVQASEVRRFGPDGEYLGSFGRAGQGPGEMMSLQGLAWLGSDTLAILDSAQGRLLLFSPEGDRLGELSYPGGVTGPTDVVRLYQASSSDVFAFAPGPDGGQRFLRYGPEGQRGFLPRRVPDGTTQSASVCPLPDGGIRFYSIPYAPRPVLHPLPGDAVLEGRTDAFRLSVVDATGDPRLVIDEELPAVRISDEEWVQETADYRTFREENPGIDCDPEPRRPDAKPPLVGAHVDGEGRLWVESRATTGREYRVYERDGRLIARVSTPEHQPGVAPAFAPGWMAVLARGDLGEDVIRLYRIRGPEDPDEA